MSARDEAARVLMKAVAGECSMNRAVDAILAAVRENLDPRFTALEEKGEPVPAMPDRLITMEEHGMVEPTPAPKMRRMVGPGGLAHYECPDCRGVCTPVEEGRDKFPAARFISDTTPHPHMAALALRVAGESEHGRAVIVSYEEYKALTAARAPRKISRSELAHLVNVYANAGNRTIDNCLPVVLRHPLVGIEVEDE